MKRLWIVMLVLAFCATSSLYAQDKNPKTKMADRISYMKSHLTLSQKESQSFWKLYEQYLNEEMKTMDNYRKNLEKQGIKLGAPGQTAHLSPRSKIPIASEFAESGNNLLQEIQSCFDPASSPRFV